MNRNVLIIQPRIPQFRVDYFNGLIPLMQSKGLDLKIAIPSQIDDPRMDERSDLVPHLPCRRIRLGVGRFRFDIMKMNLKSSNPDLIIIEHAMRTFLIFIYLKVKGYDTALWGHGINYTSSESLVARRIKQWVARKACHYFVYTEGGRRALLKQGLQNSKIHVMNNTISNPFLVPQVKPFISVQKMKNEFIRQHNLRNKQVFVFIGGIDKSKRLDFLLESFNVVSNLHPSAVLLLFGDGPDRSRLERCNTSSKILFLGAATVETKRILAEIATCILMPGRVGLIAIDSFQMGLPIISTNFDFHAPEFEYLISGHNSLISENNIQAYVKAINKYLEDPSLQIQLKLGARESERFYSLHNMQHGFVNKVLEILNESGVVKNVN